MSEEIQQAVQIIRVAYDGIEIAMKVGSGTVEQMKKAVDFLIAILDHEKTMGKTDMRKLLLKGGDLQVLQFATEDMKQVEKMAKKYGILYSVLPDINKKDGMSEIIFHTEAVPRVNMMIQKLKSGRIATFDDYLKNSDEKELEKVMSFLKGQKKGNDNLHTAEAAKAGEALEGLSERSVCMQWRKRPSVWRTLRKISVLRKNRHSRWSVSLRESVCLPKRITDSTRSSWIRMPFLTVSEAIRSWHSVCRP